MSSPVDSVFPPYLHFYGHCIMPQLSLSTFTLGQSASGQAVCVGEHAEDGRPQCAVILTAYAAHHPGGSGEIHSNNLHVYCTCTGICLYMFLNER